MSSIDSIAAALQEDGFMFRSLDEALRGTIARLIGVYDERRLSGQAPQKLFVITDLGKDIDDTFALIAFAALSLLGLVEIKGVIANLEPAGDRVRLVQGVLDLLNLEHVPVARGTEGSDVSRAPFPYEFDCDFIAPPDTPFRTGRELLHDTLIKTEQHGEKLNLVLLSTLQDISEFAQEYPELLLRTIASVHMQGGHTLGPDGRMAPDARAANNKFHLAAAEKFHAFLETSGLPSVTYTKYAAFAAPVSTDLVHWIAETDHPLGAYLESAHRAQETAFYSGACDPDPNQRFQPFMDQEWYLRNKTAFFKTHTFEDVRPVGEEVVQWLPHMFLYDIIAGLGAAGEDVAKALQIFKLQTDKKGLGHRQIGEPDESGVNAEALVTTIEALVKLLFTLLAEGHEGDGSNAKSQEESGR